MTSVYRQFTHPTGWLGAVVGMLMAVKNRERSEWVLSQLGAGRVDRRHGAMPELPFADASFDKAYAINAYQFWPHTSRSLAELRRVLR